MVVALWSPSCGWFPLLFPAALTLVVKVCVDEGKHLVILCAPQPVTCIYTRCNTCAAQPAAAAAAEGEEGAEGLSDGNT